MKSTSSETSSDSSVLDPLRAYICRDMEGLCASHDVAHLQRVSRIAHDIADRIEEPLDRMVIEAWAWCHEFFDAKFFTPAEMADRQKNLHSTLSSLPLSGAQIWEIMTIAQGVWFGKALERPFGTLLSREFQIVEDADRIEAIGAIGIARTFAYGAKAWRPLYDPTQLPRVLVTADDYRAKWASSLHHFDEKLLRVYDLLHTDAARIVALPRHQVLQDFYRQFMYEWFYGEKMNARISAATASNSGT